MYSAWDKMLRDVPPGSNVAHAVVSIAVDSHNYYFLTPLVFNVVPCLRQNVAQHPSCIQFCLFIATRNMSGALGEETHLVEQAEQDWYRFVDFMRPRAVDKGYSILPAIMEKQLSKKICVRIRYAVEDSVKAFRETFFTVWDGHSYDAFKEGLTKEVEYLGTLPDLL